MSSTAEDGAAAYFRVIEEAFLRLRGAPLVLSPADWQLAEQWHRAGVPLELVCSALEEVFARRRERRARGRINSLRYCAPAVEQAWGELRELTAGGLRGEAGGAVLDPTARLRALAARLPADLPAPLERRIAAVRRSLLALADQAPTDAAAVEEGLATTDRELLAGLLEALPGGERAALVAEAEDAARAAAARLPAGEKRSLVARLAGEAVRRRWGLPVLSLFAPEADPGPAAPGSS